MGLAILGALTLTSLTGVVVPGRAYADPVCTITGTSGPDQITGTANDDVICAGDGDDVIDGGGGNDTIYAGTGVDVVYGGAGNDVIYGGNDNDQLSGGDGDDRLYGEMGTDDLTGDAGNDQLVGGDDADTLAGGDGADILYGGLGTDRLSGDAGDDQLYGENDADWLSGADGNDLLEGGYGTDEIYGGDGNDQLKGGADADILRGGTGVDTLTGDFGTDNLDGGPGADVVDGGNDSDTCITEVTGGQTSSCETALTDTSADTVASYATSSAPEPLPNLPVSATGTGYQSVADTVKVTAPSSPQGTVTLTDTATSTAPAVTVGIPQTTTSTPAVVSRDNSVVYDAPGNALDVTAQVLDGGVRLTTVQTNPAAPARYAYPLTIPAGATLSTEDDGQISIKSSSGDFVAGMAAPWAQDATGATLPTHYEISGTTVTQVVDTSGPGIVYPVVADPFLGIRLISSVKPVNNPLGLTYQVYPTAYGRWAADWIHLGFGWPEIRSKGVPDRQGLKEQYWCHPIAYLPRFKSSWNLDTWRPTVGLPRTLAAKCNP